MKMKFPSRHRLHGDARRWTDVADIMQTSRIDEPEVIPQRHREHESRRGAGKQFHTGERFRDANTAAWCSPAAARCDYPPPTATPPTPLLRRRRRRNRPRPHWIRKAAHAKIDHALRRKSMPPPTQAEVKAAKKGGTRHATIKTSKGDIEVEMYGDLTPLTVANFVKLIQAKFYDGLTFHRVEPDFVIQGGDPNGDGTGGPGYTIQRELAPGLLHEDGALAMARASDPDSAGCQFYITIGAQHFLDNQYTVFGKVTKGMDVVHNIAKGDKIISIVMH